MSLYKIVGSYTDAEPLSLPALEICTAREVRRARTLSPASSPHLPRHYSP
jgi:hypothetical protein